MTKNRTPQRPAMTLELATGEYGIPQPSIRIDLGAGANFRLTHAALHLVAARAEILSGRERWCVQTRPNDSFDHKGRVYLELGDGSDAEAARGMALLQQVLDQETAAVRALSRGAR